MMATAPSYMAPGSEFDLAQQQASRQHLLAQSLMQQSQQPLQGQMVGQYYAAPSWTEGLAKMLQGYAGMQVNKNADQSLLDARSAYDTRNMNSSNDFMDQLTGTPAQNIQSPSNDASDTKQVFRPAQAADPNAALKIAMENPQNPTLAGMGQSMLANKLDLAQTQSLFDIARNRTANAGAPTPSAPSAPPGPILPGMGAYLSQGSTPSAPSTTDGAQPTPSAPPGPILPGMGAYLSQGAPPGASSSTSAPSESMHGVDSFAAGLLMSNKPGLMKLGEAIQSANSPTDLMKTMRASGINESSPLWAQILQANITKTNNIPLVSGRAGAPMYGPGGQIVAMAPKIPDNAIPQIQNGQITGVTSLPGAQEVVQSNAKGEALGKLGGTLGSGFVNGKPTFFLGAPPGTAGADTGTTAPGRFPGAPADPASAVTPSLGPAASAAATQVGTAAGKQYMDDSNSSNGYASRMFTLDKALTGLQNADTGPGSDTVNYARSFLLSQTPFNLGTYLKGVDPDKIASYDEANKYMTQYAIGKAGALGEGTDSKLATTLAGNASTSISNLAAVDVVKANMGLERMAQAQVQQFNNTGLPAEQYPKWSTQWNKAINPSVFVWDSLDATKKAAAAATMTPAQKSAFTTQYNWAIQNKFINGPQ